MHATATPFAGQHRGPALASYSSAVATAVVTLALILHASMRGLYADLDAAIYASWYTELGTLSAQDFFDRLRESGWIFQAREQAIAKFEWGFALLAWSIASTGLPIGGFFAAIAALSLAPKAVVAWRLSPHPALSMLWYGSYCYLLLEMNAMRAGLAAALMLMALLAMQQRQWWRWLVLIGVASTFHSAALVALLLPMATWLARRPWWFAVLVVAALALSVVDVAAALAVLGGTFEKIAEYKAAFDTGFGDVAYLRLNPLNSSSLPFILIAALASYQAFRAPLSQSMPERTGAVVLALPLLSLFAFSSFPIVGARLSELLCVYQMIFVMVLIDRYAQWNVGKSILVATMAIQFTIQQFLTLHVDVFYFLGEPRPAMLLLIEQKAVIDAVLAEIFSTLQ